MKDILIVFVAWFVGAVEASSCPDLIWHDEFYQLESGIWSYQTGDGCPELCGWGNGELEIYTDSSENALVDSGVLKITATTDGKGNYYSARLRTKDKVAVDFTKPRRIEARIMTAGGPGVWPAFWLMPNDLDDMTWPQGGEIDIMEHRGMQPNMVR